jgi:uncharacterized protein (TIGR01777 family)
MATVLISGGIGLVGKALSKQLITQGHEVRILSRNPKQSSGVKSFFWNVEQQQIDEVAFEGLDHIVHLAGEGIADKRWTDQRKCEIISSRVDSMKLISDTVKRNNIQLKSFVGASAIGIYGMVISDKLFSESDIGVKDFLSETCTQWENAYHAISSNSVKISVIRIGVVLSEEGGALKKLLPQFKLGLGSALGSGKQYMPWIHLDDLVSVFVETLFNPKYKNVYNAVTAEHITNKEFSLQLAKALHKPFFLPGVPFFVLKIALGEMANMILTGPKISNQKLINEGFVFQYPDLASALQRIDFRK